MPQTSNPSCLARALTSSALTVRSCYSPRMRGKVAAVLLAILWFAPPPDPYLDVLHDYLTGNPNRALARLVTMDSVTVSTGAHALPQQRDGRLLQAAAAIHTEAALLPRDDSGYLAYAYHLALARDIVEYGELHAKRRQNAIDLVK